MSDDVHVSDVEMREVATPLHLATTGPSMIGNVSINRLKATGVYRSAASVESWSERPIERVDLRNWDVQFVGGFGPAKKKSRGRRECVFAPPAVSLRSAV
jgi:hypothetical protein